MCVRVKIRRAVGLVHGTDVTFANRDKAPRQVFVWNEIIAFFFFVAKAPIKCRFRFCVRAKGAPLVPKVSISVAVTFVTHVNAHTLHSCSLSATPPPLA